MTHVNSCARVQFRQVLPLYSLQLLFIFFHAFIVMACSFVYILYFLFHACCCFLFTFSTLVYSLSFISPFMPVAVGGWLVFTAFVFVAFILVFVDIAMHWRYPDNVLDIVSERLPACLPHLLFVGPVGKFVRFLIVVALS